MSVDRRLLNWGVFLLLLGGVPLAVAQGWIPSDVAARAWELWPFLLIGSGIGLILSRTPLRALGGVIVAATFGTILGALLAIGVGGFNVGGFGCGEAKAGDPVVLQDQGTFGAGGGSVRLVANCAAVRVTTAPGPAWQVAVRGSDTARPTVEKSGDQVTVRSPDRPIVVPFGTQRSTWDVTLPGDPLRLGLDFTVNAGDADVDVGTATVPSLRFTGNAISSTLDLHAATVDQVDVNVNAGSIAIQLPEAASLHGAVTGNASAIRLCAAGGVGLRLVVDDNITASNNYADQGLVRTGNTWETPGYSTAATRTELRTTGSAVSYKLNPEDGCR